MSDVLAMPSFGIAAAALRKTTEHLAREVVTSSATPPDWSELEWAVAQAVAAMQGISALLAHRLQWSGPPGWQSFLAGQLEHSRLRHAAVGLLLQRVDDSFRQDGLSAVALKGSALRGLDLYRCGERPQGDVDLLVRVDEIAAIERALRRLDYLPSHAMRRHLVFEPRVMAGPTGFGEHIDNPLKIEVHTEVAEPLPVGTIDITSALRAAEPSPGLNGYPDLASLILHLLLHTAGNIRAHTMRQIQLHDIAALATRMSDGDWRAVLNSSSSGERRWWLYPPLALTDRYYPGRIPAGVLHESRTACHRTLRMAADRWALTDVSWSNLRISAFPGIAWSRTPAEALRFVRSRLLPSRAALDELEIACDAQPQLKQIPWYGISHGERVLRWAFSRPPRVQTMMSLRGALEGAGLQE